MRSPTSPAASIVTYVRWMKSLEAIDAPFLTSITMPLTLPASRDIPHPILTLTIAGASFAIAYRLYKSINTTKEPFLKAIPSPVTTLLPTLSPSQIADLPYPPDTFPGARDVESPYGTLRVYEWGPEEGRKVLLVHGISTPCVSLGQ